MKHIELVKTAYRITSKRQAEILFSSLLSDVKVIQLFVSYGV